MLRAVIAICVLGACSPDGVGGFRPDLTAPDLLAADPAAAGSPTTLHINAAGALHSDTALPVALAQVSTGAAQAAAATNAVTAGKINSIETIVNDMTLENDARLDGIPNFLWATGPKPAAVVMGTDPRGSRMQAWWLNLPRVRDIYKDADLWTAYLQWFVIFEGVGNRANNVRVEVRNPRTYYLSRSSGAWKALGPELPGSKWFLARKTDLMWTSGDVDIRDNTDGSRAIKLPVNAAHVCHGVWAPARIDIAATVSDMASLFATVQARLVVDDPSGADDRHQANLLLQIGGDFYPDMTATATESFPPGVGLSRAKRITHQWQSFNFATIDAARQDYRGAPAAMPTEQFRRHPPPLE